VALAAGLVALATRRVEVGSIVIVASVGLLGLWVPVQRPPRAALALRLGVGVAGVAAFAFARAAITGPPPAAGMAVAVGGVVAALAEESFFRRALYGRLERWGVPVAVAGSALAFALVHVPAYGWGVVPVDLAAGFVLGWQRWASRSWAVPAATHAVANLVQVI
jgi:hypothetical protein